MTAVECDLMQVALQGVSLFDKHPEDLRPVAGQRDHARVHEVLRVFVHLAVPGVPDHFADVEPHLKLIRVARIVCDLTVRIGDLSQVHLLASLYLSRCKKHQSRC